MAKRANQWTLESDAKKICFGGYASKKVNVLCIGLSEGCEIISHLMLIPELTTLYIIDNLLEFAEGNENNIKLLLEEQKEEIRNILIAGNDESADWRKTPLFGWYDHDTDEEHELKTKDVPINYLKTKSEIVSDTDNGKVWRLKFIYDNVLRTIVYYHRKNYHDDWSSEIVNIKHIISSIPIWRCVYSIGIDNFNNFIKMLETRTRSVWTFYGGSLWKHFQIQLKINYGWNPTESYFVKQINKISNRLWKFQLFPADWITRDEATYIMCSEWITEIQRGPTTKLISPNKHKYDF